MEVEEGVRFGVNNVREDCLEWDGEHYVYNNCVPHYPYICVYNNFHYDYQCFPAAADDDPRFIILIDRSSSMATEVTLPLFPPPVTSRLDLAKRSAASHVQDIFSNFDHPLVSVMCFTALEPNPDFEQLAPGVPPPRVQIVLNFSDDGVEVLDAISKIPEPTGESCLAEALCFAADVLQAQPEPANKYLYLYTDGGQDDWEWVDVLGSTCSGCFASNPHTWLPGCSPYECIIEVEPQHPCSDLQCCLAQNMLSGIDPVTWRVTYFGPVTSELSPPGTTHPDFNFLKCVGRQSSGGWFEHVSDNNLLGLFTEFVPGMLGHTVRVSIDGLINNTPLLDDLLIGGFDLLIAYDASALTFLEAMPGELLDTCAWEYFTYRTGPFGNCGDACPSGLLRIIALAETNNGPIHPSCLGPPDTDPHELVEMTFLVSNDRTFDCQFVPVRFFWMDCGDNTISSVTGDTLFVSRHVYSADAVEISDSTYGFPTYYGVQSECIIDPDGEGPKIPPLRFVDFTNGGVKIICADSIDDRGDINLNGVMNEVADAVVFTNYFVYGLSAFVINVEGQIAATDVNADGIVLSVADLVYLIRVIIGDALPYPKLAPTEAKYDIDDGVLSIDRKIGAAYMVIKGKANPINLTGNMEMKSNYDKDRDETHVLLYSMEKGQTFEGDFLEFEGSLLEIEAATYDGAMVKFTTELLPKEFVLYQNRPNPFNPITGISFSLPVASDVTLEIFNINGQKVATVAKDRFEPGTHTVEWDGTNYASGVYLYKIKAGDFNDTKKMLLIK